ncbi:hypothetical protein AVMA1855_22725 [Acidovorax sp. SUPP1855]|nr:hypothetical protein AVMA1855_22725 [Acidovorax sp. SUPP1855]
MSKIQIEPALTKPKPRTAIINHGSTPLPCHLDEKVAP